MTINRNGILSADLDIPVVLPTLNLDFANSQSLDERITFTRGSIGTFVNKNGLIETAAANIPRFDYDPITGECKGLLIEESRQNIVLNSTTLSSHTNSATSDNVTTETTSPDGTFNAYKVIGNSGVRTRQSIYSNSFTMNANSSYTASVFLKGTGTRRYVVMWFDNTAPGNAPTEGPYYGSSVFIDLLTGTSSNPSIVKMIPYGNGWYRCYVTATVGASNLTNVLFNVSIGSPNGFSDTGNPSIYKYVGDGISGIYYWGPQVEVGAFPTSYIPTTTSSVTRSAEIAEMTGTNFSSWYNQTEGTFFFDGTLPFITNDTTARVPYGVSNGFNFSNSIYVSKGTTSLGLSFSVINNNVSQSTGSTSLPPMTSSKIKIASSVADKNIYSCGYGGTVNKHSRPSAAIPTVNRLTLGKEPWNLSTLNPMIGTIRKFAYYPKALSPSQLQYLTQ